MPYMYGSFYHNIYYCSVRYTNFIMQYKYKQFMTAIVENIITQTKIKLIIINFKCFLFLYPLSLYDSFGYKAHFVDPKVNLISRVH